MKRILQICLPALMLFFFSCDYVEEVIIYHEPHLNIYANITAADKSLNYVHVFRTTAYGEPDRYETDSIIYHEFWNPSSGDTIRYQTLYLDTSYAVNKAEVYYFHDEDTIRFYERSQGVYVPLDSHYTIHTGDVYGLWVNTEEYGLATATETAVAPVEWDDTASCVISLSDPVDTLKWGNIAAAYEVIFRFHYDYGEWQGSYIFESEEVREAFWIYDSSKYDPIFNPDPFARAMEVSESGILELTVSIVAYSASYMDYKDLENMQMTTGIIRYPTINDFRVNIDNALGAFTSISISDERKIKFVP
jgi:hypothetical protein